MLRALGGRMASVPSGPLHVVVVGAGVTGLSAAHFLKRDRPDWTVTVLEARPDPGGNIRTERTGGFVVDAGPDSFVRTKPHAVELCKELGLEGEFISTEETARNVYVAHDGRLELLPGGMALAVPTRLEPWMKTPLVGLAAKLRLMGEPLVPRAEPGTDESIHAFFARRLGEEAAEKLAGPLLGGIYAGDVRELSMRATFPQLVELEEKHGSLLRGFLAAELERSGHRGASPGVAEVLSWLRRKGAAHAASPFVSLRSGMGTLIDRLVASLPEGSVRTGVTVTGVTRQGSTFRVETEGGDPLLADAVVLAAPAHVAARLVGDPEAATELASIRYVSTATVFFALPREGVAHDLQGFGFIVPPGEAEILAATWVSSKWAGRAPPGAVLIRAFVGGARDEARLAESTDEQLVTLARRDLERFMGPLGEPLFTRVYRYAKSNPQPAVGHLRKLERLKARLAEIPGLFVCGAAYEGVGIPDCVRQARAAVDGVFAALAERVAAGAE